MAKRALSTVAAAAISSGCGSRPAIWLLKSEPADYSISMMERDTTTQWDGVRNPVARKNMRAMKAGDRCFFYHSSCSKVGIVGVVSVCKEAYPDPSDEKWACVDVKHEETWGEILPLEALKSHATTALDGMTLFRQPRLSVQPVSQEHAEFIIKLASEPSATNGGTKGKGGKRSRAE